MKKRILIVTVILAIVIGCGATVFALQGLDTTKPDRVPSEDEYSSVTITAEDGSATISRSDLANIGAGTAKGLHVTDGKAMFSLDQTACASASAKAQSNEVTFTITYLSEDNGISFAIDDGEGNDCFPTLGRCVGEHYITVDSTVNTNGILVVDGDSAVAPLSAYYPDAGVVRWQLTGGGDYKIKVSLKTFGDINSHWGKDYIEFLASHDIASGMGNGKFSPDNGLTRAQFVTLLARISMEDISSCSGSTFTDVKSTQWYYKYVYWAYEAGITSGTSSTTFSPEMKITREQMAVMSVNFLEYMNIDVTAVRTSVEFPDASSIHSWATEEVQDCYEMAILNGDQKGYFNPLNTATRAEASTICTNLIAYTLIMPQ